MPQLAPWQRGGSAHPGSLQIPVADYFTSVAVVCVLLACPACPSLIPLRLGKGGMVGRAGEVSAGSPQGCRLGWVQFLEVGPTRRQRLLSAQTPYFANPWLSACRNTRRQGVGGCRQRWRGAEWR